MARPATLTLLDRPNNEPAEAGSEVVGLWLRRGAVRRTLRAARSATHRGGPCSGSLAVSRRRGATTLRTDPTALLYVATVLAQRLDSANRALLDLKRQIQAGEPHSVVGRTVEKIEGLLGASGANLVYAGYPYDPFTTP
jgi:hypothetical protein